MRLRSKLFGYVIICTLAVSCGDSSSPSVAGGSDAISETTTPPLAVAVTEPMSTSTTVGSPVASVSALGVAAERSLSEGKQTSGLLPGALPYGDYADTGAARFSDDSWAWTAGWSWIGGNRGTLPTGEEAGYDWSLNFSSVPADTSFEIPKNAVKLFSRGELEYFALNSSCEFGEGLATSTTIWVSRAGQVVALGTVSETVARCDWPARTMSPEELVDLLLATVDCTFGDGMTPRCADLPAVSDDERSLAVKSLEIPGL
jgi:hypothetical protein